MYKSKEVCQGCKTPGTEKPRMNKDDLCESCQKFLQTGMASKLYKEVKFCNAFLHYHAYYNQHVSDFAHSILEIIDNPTAEFTGGYHDLSEKHWGNNGKRYIINEKLLLPLRQFFRELDSKETEFKNKLDNLPETVADAVKEEKDKIFNEGITKGRDLLFQLNAGQITTEDFEKNLAYRGA